MIIVVEVRRGGGEGGEGAGVDIKSNNPHLAGGEKMATPKMLAYFIARGFIYCILEKWRTLLRTGLLMQFKHYGDLHMGRKTANTGKHRGDLAEPGWLCHRSAHAIEVRQSAKNWREELAFFFSDVKNYSLSIDWVMSGYSTICNSLRPVSNVLLSQSAYVFQN